MIIDNLTVYNELFLECFELTSDKLGADLVYQSIENWDSVGHMQLVAALEEAFDIMLDTDDIIDFSSYDIGKLILGKYGVEF